MVRGLGVLALVWVTGCSLLSDPDGPPLRCVWPTADGGADPCPDDLRCVAGVCVACDPNAAEVCDNGKDDDCDARVDEGKDLDGDGFLTCARTVGAPVDCDDDARGAHPGGAEVCDGRDGDCDGVVDEAGSLCPDEVPACRARRCVSVDDCGGGACPADGLVCDTPAGQPGYACVEGTPCDPSDVDACPKGTVCDPGGSGLCVGAEASVAGGACRVDAECPAGAPCVAGVVLPGLPGEAPVARCLAPCSTDLECADGQICWADPGSGARACVAGGEVAGLVLGEAPPGTPCDGPEAGPEACRSGACAPVTGPEDDEPILACLGRCARSLDCGPDRVCRHDPDPRVGVIGRCVPISPGRLADGAECAADDACLSDLCLDHGRGARRCADLCATSEDCPLGRVCRVVAGGPGRGWVGACRPLDGPDLAPSGADCGADPACESGLCLDGTCASRCPVPGECPGLVCGYARTGARWVAHCVEL